ncbi:MAG: Tim44-like domain-containing protein [Hydrogenophaga sp.]|nr:Tim44-like domain-containing protein [Hydrogenophaga sp.]
MTKLLSMVLVCAMALGSADAWAKRMGGGKSFGKQSNQVTQRDATPPANNAAPASPAAQPGAANRPANAAPAAPASRPWGAMLGGLAAGLGLAWLASSLGFGEGFGQVLMLLLAGVAIWMVVRMVMRSRQSNAGGMAYQGATAAQAPRNYNSNNVGNDASARPWESNQTPFSAAPVTASGGSMIGSALGGQQTWGIPAGFDVDGFIAASKTNFMTLQAAWDRGDISSLRAMMTDEMLAEIKTQLADREQASAGQPNVTEILALDARLLGIEELDDVYMASVEYNGLSREDASAGPSPFREVWNITRPKNGPGGWLVAGVQALE